MTDQYIYFLFIFLALRKYINISKPFYFFKKLKKACFSSNTSLAVVNRCQFMNKFWPPRGDVNGFSIEKLAKESRKKMSKSDRSLLNQDDSIKVSHKVSNNVLIPIHLNHSNSHWANRHFEEYRQSA